MFEYLRGKLIDKCTDHIVIDVNGVGYKLLFPATHFGQLPSIDVDVIVYTSFVVRELSQTLYAFVERIQRNLFEFLITLSGIGPKTALALIGCFSASELNQAVQMQNIALLTKVPGIGKKSAERLIVELKGKLEPFMSEKPEESINISPKIKDALNALLNLGFHPGNAQQAVKQAVSTLPGDADLSSIISFALRCAN